MKSGAMGNRNERRHSETILFNLLRPKLALSDFVLPIINSKRIVCVARTNHFLQSADDEFAERRIAVFDCRCSASADEEPTAHTIWIRSPCSRNHTSPMQKGFISAEQVFEIPEGSAGWLDAGRCGLRPQGHGLMDCWPAAGCFDRRRS